MKVSVIASGSKGNSTLIIAGKYKILIDIGISCLCLENNLREMGVKPSEITHVFITHTHVDHISGLKLFYKKYQPLIYLTEKMHQEIDFLNINYNYINEIINFDDLTVIPVKTSHDVSESLGYLLEYNNKSLVHITDTGYINSKVKKRLENKDLYIIESNYDVEMLMNSNRPHHVKLRILGDKGHLSNEDCSNYLKELVGEKTKKIILAHLSQEANHPDIAIKILKEKLYDKNIETITANQNKRTELIEV